jgi:hypothetical protein
MDVSNEHAARCRSAAETAAETPSTCGLWHLSKRITYSPRTAVFFAGKCATQQTLLLNLEPVDHHGLRSPSRLPTSAPRQERKNASRSHLIQAAELGSDGY